MSIKNNKQEILSFTGLFGRLGVRLCENSNLSKTSLRAERNGASAYPVIATNMDCFVASAPHARYAHYDEVW